MTRLKSMTLSLLSLTFSACSMSDRAQFSLNSRTKDMRTEVNRWAKEDKESLQLLVDSNRDGRLSEQDLTSEKWTWQGRGAFVLPNVDDDDQDGRPDCADGRVNGIADEKDLTHFSLSWSENLPTQLRSIRIKLRATSPDAPVQLFMKSTSGWQIAEGDYDLEQMIQSGQNSMQLAIESCAFASQSWDGFMNLTILDSKGDVARSVTLRASPFLMIPNTARMQSFYVSQDTSGRYGNKNMLFQLPLPLLLNGIVPKIYRTDSWEEMWMQDTMEIGYSESPTSRMHIVLVAPRGNDRFGPSLLGPDVGVLNIAEPRSQANPTDGWIDWFGNLEVSPATEKFPLGRIYYGHNPATGNALHPDVVSFLEAQELQKPVAIDSGWLFIKHVDEMLTFWPSPRRRGFVAVMPSPQKAADILKTELDETNTYVQQRLDSVREGSEDNPSIYELFGLSRDQLIFQPLMYEDGEHGAVGQWSNPVNSVSINSSILYGRTKIPDAVHASIKKTILDQRLIPVGVDDSAYQPRLGNVHCASNSMRNPSQAPFWSSTGKD